MLASVADMLSVSTVLTTEPHAIAPAIGFSAHGWSANCTGLQGVAARLQRKMALRLRSFLPYTLPGFLAFIGWWWYASHKKGGINDHEKEKEDRSAPLGLPPPPDEGSSNGSLKNGDLNGTGRGRRMRKEEKPAETLPTEILGMQDMPSQALCRKLNTERDPSDKGASLLASMDNSSHPLLPKTRGKTSVPMRSEEADASASAIQQCPVDGQDVAAVGLETENVPLRSESPCTEIGSPIKELVEAVRPEPEGEVATDKTSAPFAEKPQTLMVNDSSQLLSSKDDRLQQLCPASPLALYLSSPVATTLVSQTEQGGLGEPRVNSQDAVLAEDTITEVLAVECLGREEEGGESASWPSVRCDGSLMTSKRSGTAQSQAKNEGDSHSNSSNELQNPLPGDPSGTRAAENWASTNGCSTPPVRMREMDSGGMCSELKSNHTAHSEGGEEGASLNPATRRAEEGTSEADCSGCRTCQLEEGFGGEDLHSTVLPAHVVPDRNEDLMQLSVISQTDGPEPLPEEQLGIVPCEDQRLKGTGAQSGGGPQANEAEEDPSGGSDSMDSGFMLGAGEGVLQGSQPMHSQFIVWELEVPKHLVGRLIGKQGRYVSFLKQSSGAKVYISTLPYTQEFQICHIEGSKQQVDIVLSLIGKKFKDLDLTNLHSPTALPHALPSLPMTSWLLLPERVTVEVIVVNIVSAGHLFVQQHTHPTFHALRSLEEQMFLCYSQPGVPALPSVTEVGVICTAPASGGAWRRAQVIAFHKESDDVDIRYVDHGGYETVKINTLRQIRSDFVTLPFQGAEVLLDNLQPLPGENGFSAEAKSALEEMTRGVALLAQVTNYDNSGLPLIQMWNMVGDKMVSVNRTLAEHGFSSWVEMF